MSFLNQGAQLSPDGKSVIIDGRTIPLDASPGQPTTGISSGGVPYTLPPTSSPGGSVTAGGGGNAVSDTLAADTAAVGTDASTLISQVLADYGLQSLGTWAWNQITSGASSQQVLLDMYQTPQFKARFPAIVARQQAGLPPLSPADYVNYEDAMKQMESQYGLPQGALSDKETVTQLLSKDVSTNEVQARVQQGYQAVAYAPPEVRQAFAGMFGVGGDGALAHFFLDPNNALPKLEQMATAAQIGGQASVGGVNVSTDDAMRLAQMGVSPASVQTTVGDLNKTAPLYEANINEANNLEAGKQGIEAAYGLNPTAQQEILQREQSRESEFAGGGAAYMDTHGAAGIGSARPF